VRAILLAVVLLAVGVAETAAQPNTPYEVAPPSSWQARPAEAKNLETALRATDHFGTTPFDVKSEAWLKDGSGAMYITFLTANEPTTTPAESVRVLIDAVRQAPFAASTLATSIEINTWNESLKDNVADVEQTWKHLSNETVTHVRALLWLNSKRHLRELRAECVYAADSKAKVESLCDAALGSLRLTTSNRGELTALPPPTDTAPPAMPALDKAPAAAPSDSKIDDGGELPPQTSIVPPGEGKVLYRGPEPSKKASMDTKWFVAGGVLLLLLAFYMTTRSREDEASGEDDEDEDAVEDAEVEGGNEDEDNIEDAEVEDEDEDEDEDESQ
jgi:hypothetical protein